MWKRQYLSKGGRLSLIKCTLSSLSIYFMSIFVILEKVSARLEKMQRDFLWGGRALEKRPRLVKWKVCYADKEGRLGIRSLVALNKLCLGSGVGDLQKKGSPFGNKSSLTSLVWRKGGGAQE